jgi:hypothetical protein
MKYSVKQNAMNSTAIMVKSPSEQFRHSDNCTSPPEMSAEECPQTFSILLEEQQSNELSPISDAKFVGSDEIRGCRISTTVSDVRYGKYADGITGEAHTACVVLLKFNFSNQLSRRIQKMSISLTFSPSQSSPTTAEGRGVPELRLFEPSSGRSQTTRVIITLDTTADASLGFNPGGKIGGEISRSIEREKISYAWLSSSQVATHTVIWDLIENAQEKQGIPSELNCAVVIRTDGVPFTASVKFEAKVRGKFGKFRGSKVAFVDENFFLNRTSAIDGEVGLLDDMGSEKFGEWVKNKTSNSWMVVE